MRCGAIAAGAATLLASLSACAGGGTTVTTTFDDVGDLQTRHGVQVADVRVGTVADIDLTDDFRAEVTLRLNRGVRVPKASKAVLRTTSLLGEKFVELRPLGEPGRGPFLEDGDTVAETEEAPELEFVAEEFATVLAAVSADDVATVIRTGAEAFGGRRQELGSLIDDLSTISRTLADRTATITAVIDNLDRASATLAQGAPDLDRLLVNLADTSRVLADNRNRAVVALDRLAALAANQNRILDRYRADIDRQIKQVDAIVAVAAAHTQEVGELVDWLDRFVRQLPKGIPGDFAQIFMWAVPAAEDPRVEDGIPNP